MKHLSEFTAADLAGLARSDVARALSEADIDGEVEKAVRLGSAMAANGAWAQNDPEHVVTYGLVAQYALDQAFREADEDAGAESEN